MGQTTPPPPHTASRDCTFTRRFPLDENNNQWNLRRGQDRGLLPLLPLGRLWCPGFTKAHILITELLMSQAAFFMCHKVNRQIYFWLAVCFSFLGSCFYQKWMRRTCTENINGVLFIWMIGRIHGNGHSTCEGRRVRLRLGNLVKKEIDVM